MKAFKIALVIAGLTAGNAFASDFSFTGNLKEGNEVQPFFLTVTEPANFVGPEERMQRARQYLVAASIQYIAI